jgi:hypothetical protein
VPNPMPYRGDARSLNQPRVDGHSVPRENRSMGAGSQAHLVSEIDRLQASIESAAAATEVTLASCPPASAGDGPRSPPAERAELRRQLAALRERVALAEDRREGPQALRAELATLLSFARMLQADADHWRSALADEIEQLERRRTAALRKQERSAAEREQLAQRRRRPAVDNSSDGSPDGAAKSRRVPQNAARVHAGRGPYRLLGIGLASQEMVSLRELLARDAQPLT